MSKVTIPLQCLLLRHHILFHLLAKDYSISRTIGRMDSKARRQRALYFEIVYKELQGVLGETIDNI